MNQSTETFTITYKSKETKVEVVSIGGQILYNVKLEDTARLFVTRAKNFNANKFWTSVPEGKQKLAEEIGELIELHYKSQI